MTKSARPKFETRRITLIGPVQLQTVLALLPNLPQDPIRPIEIVIQEKAPKRKLDQNSLMWVGPLKDIAEQCYMDGRAFSDRVWHEYLKKEFLPETFEPELTKEGYTKWDFDPMGDKVLVGSTTDLTVKGFAQYLEQVYAFGANLGVEFHANPNEQQGY